MFFHPTHVVARGRGARDLRRNKPVRGATERRRVVIRTRIEIVRGVPSGFGRFRVVWENENLIKKKKTFTRNPSGIIIIIIITSGIIRG